MRNRDRMVAIAVVLAGVTAMAGGISLAQNEHSEPGSVEGSVNEMWAQFYSGSIVRAGKFPGKLVCLRCDLKPGPEAMKQCKAEGHRHALSMEDSSMIHPLVPGTAEVLERINSAELHDKEVVVRGKYYPASGVIVAGTIEEKK